MGFLRFLRTPDGLLWCVVGLVSIAGVVIGMQSSLARDELRRAPSAPPAFFSAGVFGHGPDATRAGIDPFAPPGLPPGVRIDRETGLMTGLTAQEVDGAVWLTWNALGPATDFEDEDQIPKTIKARHGTQVAIAGFVKALDAPSAMRRFLLVGSHLACCFGTWPGPAGMIEVFLANSAPPTDARPEPVLITGRLEIEPLHDTWRGQRRLVLAYRLMEARVRPLAR